MSAWHRAHASLPETLVADLEEDSFTALCGTRSTTAQHRSSDKRSLLKAINIDFMPASEAAEFVPATSQLAYSEHLMALRFIVGVVSIPGSELYAQPVRLGACAGDFERNSGGDGNGGASGGARSS